VKFNLEFEPCLCVIKLSQLYINLELIHSAIVLSESCSIQYYVRIAKAFFATTYNFMPAAFMLTRMGNNVVPLVPVIVSESTDSCCELEDDALACVQ